MSVPHRGPGSVTAGSAAANAASVDDESGLVPADPTEVVGAGTVGDDVVALGVDVEDGAGAVVEVDGPEGVEDDDGVDVLGAGIDVVVDVDDVVDEVVVVVVDVVVVVVVVVGIGFGGGAIAEHVLPDAGSPAAASTGGSAKGTASKSKQSRRSSAFASRKVIASRFHFVSMNLRIDVWSCTTCDT